MEAAARYLYSAAHRLYVSPRKESRAGLCVDCVGGVDGLRPAASTYPAACTYICTNGKGSPCAVLLLFQLLA